MALQTVQGTKALGLRSGEAAAKHCDRCGRDIYRRGARAKEVNLCADCRLDSWYVLNVK